KLLRARPLVLAAGNTMSSPGAGGRLAIQLVGVLQLSSAPLPVQETVTAWAGVGVAKNSRAITAQAAGASLRTAAIRSSVAGACRWSSNGRSVRSPGPRLASQPNRAGSDSFQVASVRGLPAPTASATADSARALAAACESVSSSLVVSVMALPL